MAATVVVNRLADIVLRNRSTNQEAVITVRVDDEHIVLGGYGWIELFDHERLHRERRLARERART
jgi:hypothetical protein